MSKNVRVPDMVLGDLATQVAACLAAERELQTLAKCYGLATLRLYFAELLDYSERLTRAELSSWPDGVYEFVNFIDDDGIQPGEIPIRVKLTISGDRLEVDFSGSSFQVKGAINSSPSFARSCVNLTVRSVMDASVPNNSGYFRPISVITPPGTIMNPRLPAAIAAHGLTGFRMIDALFGALAQVRPERVPAACEGGNTGVSIGGWESEHGPFIFVEFVCGTGGARPDLDGVDGHTNSGVCMCNVPCEVVEIESPVVIKRYGFQADSGGAGRKRGGLALVCDFRFVGQESILQVRADRQKHLPFGLAGGRPGTPSWNVLGPDGEARELPSKFTMTIQRGDLLHHVQPGGGGYGDPLERDPAAVLVDGFDERLSPDYARGEYGVVVDPSNQRLDREGTLELRRALAAARS